MHDEHLVDGNNNDALVVIILQGNCSCCSVLSTRILQPSCMTMIASFHVNWLEIFLLVVLLIAHKSDLPPLLLKSFFFVEEWNPCNNTKLRCARTDVMYIPDNTMYTFMDIVKKKILPMKNQPKGSTFSQHNSTMFREYYTGNSYAQVARRRHTDVMVMETWHIKKFLYSPSNLSFTHTFTHTCRFRKYTGRLDWIQFFTGKVKLLALLSALYYVADGNGRFLLWMRWSSQIHFLLWLLFSCNAYFQAFGSRYTEQALNHFHLQNIRYVDTFFLYSQHKYHLSTKVCIVKGALGKEEEKQKWFSNEMHSMSVFSWFTNVGSSIYIIHNLCFYKLCTYWIYTLDLQPRKGQVSNINVYFV